MVCIFCLYTVCRQSPAGMASFKEAISKRAALQILPCTVSQLLSASEVGNGTFAICDWELNQVSVVGIIRAYAPFVTNIQYSVDDMTGPPLNVKQWVNTEDCALMTSASPGMYVKVTGSLHSFSGQRSLLAMNIRCIKDLNEITSHMLEVVQAHVQLFGKVFDVNMNTTAASLSRRVLRHGGGGHPEGIVPDWLSTIQGQVMHVIRSLSSLHDLKTQLCYLGMSDIRTSLAFLVNEGCVFSTNDEHHFKSTAP
ncbi:replication protein A 32 kDa subunit-like [Chelmon rostratus]|uniref:replication protein A 32 kDa subunit-like n=1 Tax=Chelmon rostratus TaxID=109905 RepID=UPI001BE96C5B|nr:replication protein A 32 kDa subunit-like [Chelmon rostratus]